ncbi:unnamed protein product [Callosobruchus maculatus]|uniref:Uncharacterized protein n=1 Tax=Callosobruchus maculatus TaxID=64391 RepID=A0A653BP32_CALMS|nr:unnamed protein product [Callosobruchus maculatus]
MTRFGSSCRISITSTPSITSPSRTGKRAKTLLLSAWLKLSPRYKSAIPWRWRSLPVIRQARFLFLPCAKNFRSRLWAWFRQSNRLHA